MLHDAVGAVRVYANVGVAGEAPVHDGFEDSMGVGGAADAVDDVVGKSVVEPGAVVDLGVGRFRRGDECEVCDDTGVFFDYETVLVFDVF